MKKIMFFGSWGLVVGLALFLGLVDRDSWMWLSVINLRVIVVMFWFIICLFSGLVVGLVLWGRKERKAKELLLLFADEFLPKDQLQKVVDSGLGASAELCDMASQDVINLQRGGLQMIGRDPQDFDYVYGERTVRFKRLQLEFHDRFGVAARVKRSFWECLNLRGNTFKAYLPGANNDSKK